MEGWVIRGHSLNTKNSCCDSFWDHRGTRNNLDDDGGASIFEAFYKTEIRGAMEFGTWAGVFCKAKNTRDKRDLR